MRRTTRLADGRELLYFDERPRGEPPPDRRCLTAIPTGSELRRDPLRDEWVTVASHRQSRTHLPDSDSCPLCPSVDGRLTEVPASDYDVAVFENRFPTFAGSAPAETIDEAPPAIDARRPGAGRCEVVSFTPDHEASFRDLSTTRVRTVIEAWIDRTLALSAIDGVEQVFVFENCGTEIGVTITHPHGQIYGYPFLTPRTAAELRIAADHLSRTGRDLADDVLAFEIADGERIVRRTDHWTAYVPFGARWPTEVHVRPNRRVADLVELTTDERDELSDVYPDVLRRIEGVCGPEAPYIAAWQQAPVRTGRHLMALRLEVFSVRRAPGKLKYLAGSESAMGAFVNDVRPEDAAEALRRAW